MNTVELVEVSKTFGAQVAVDALSLAVPEGSVYGFIGPNGSGKTTTLRMILNIFAPDRGAIRVFGESQRTLRDARVGFLPEERGLYRRMGVREVLLFFGELKTGRPPRREVDAWLERFGLADCANKKVEALSKGMAQKVQFITAVLGRPRLLVLDEPFSGLDPVNLDLLRHAVLDLKAAGTTVLFSTHDMNMAERMCDYIFMIFRGKKVLDGTLRSIQDEYGADTLRVRTEGGLSVLTDLAGVEQVDDYGQTQLLRLSRHGDPQAVLRTLLQRTKVFGFEVTRPSLHDIFVRIAGPASEERNRA